MNINQNKTLTKGTFEIRLRWPELAGVDAARLYDVGDPNETRTLTIVRVLDGLVIEVQASTRGSFGWEKQQFNFLGISHTNTEQALMTG